MDEARHFTGNHALVLSLAFLLSVRMQSIPACQLDGLNDRLHDNEDGFLEGNQHSSQCVEYSFVRFDAGQINK